MSAPLLAICDPDITYSTQLLRYLEDRRDFPYVVRLFSSYLLCRQALQSQEADLLLLSTDCCPPGEEIFPAKKCPASCTVIITSNIKIASKIYPA